MTIKAIIGEPEQRGFVEPPYPYLAKSGDLILYVYGPGTASYSSVSAIAIGGKSAIYRPGEHSTTWNKDPLVLLDAPITLENAK